VATGWKLRSTVSLGDASAARRFARKDLAWRWGRTQTGPQLSWTNPRSSVQEQFAMAWGKMQAHVGAATQEGGTLRQAAEVPELLFL